MYRSVGVTFDEFGTFSGPTASGPRVSGHVYRQERVSGDRWVAKWRDAEGHQHKRVLGPVWTKRGRPGEGHLTKRTAEVALERILFAARQDTLAPEASRVTFAEAADEWLRHGEVERGLKRSTLNDYRILVRVHLKPAFGEMRLADITPKTIEDWRSKYLTETAKPRNTAKALAVVHGIFERARRAYGFPHNPAQLVEKHPPKYSGDYDWYSPEEIAALVRNASSDQDAAIYAMAAMTGLRRGELMALRWRDVDFADSAIRVRGNLSYGEVVTPKSGKVRVVPLVDQVATHLARLGQRELFTHEDDPVFVGDLGGHMDGSALRRRYQQAVKGAGLRYLPFHSLRHHFGSIAINRASLIQVKAWMGHADIRTTMRYLHHRSQAEDAKLLAEAFEAKKTKAPPVPPEGVRADEDELAA